MKIFIGADHRGFRLKESLKMWLQQDGHQVVDCGNATYEPDDDYPDFAFAVAEAVVKERESRGIVLCGSAVGVNIAANKIGGARCSTAITAAEVKKGREDDDLNILSISADFTNELDARAMIRIFLETPFAPDERHVRRLQKIAQRETHR